MPVLKMKSPLARLPWTTGSDVYKFHGGKKAKLPAYAWPGGYPILYLDHDGETLCADCAMEATFGRHRSDRSRPEAYFVHEEGPPEFCAGCSEATESAYGDPDNPDAE